MQLRPIISALTPLKVDGYLSAEVTGIAYEARRVAPGNIYFALARPGTDVQSDVEIAVERGAAAVVCRRNGSMRRRAAVIEVSDTRQALADVAAMFYGHAGAKLQVIGVAGHGAGWKTAFLLAGILRENGVKAGLISRFRYEVGERRLPAAASLESADVQRLFADMVRAGCTTCVLELPEISAEALRGIPLDVLVIAGEEQTFDCYSKYLTSTRDRRPKSVVINRATAVGHEAANSVFFERQMTFGRSTAAQVTAQELTFGTESTTGTLQIANVVSRFEVPLIGSENLHHLLAAVAAARTIGLDASDIAEAIQVLPTPPGSLELVDSDATFPVYVDEARDERSLETTLRALRSVTSGRILLLLGASEKTTGKERFNMGRIAAKYAQYLILTGDNPGREPVDQICSAMAQGLESGGATNYHFQPDRAEAISEVIGLARTGDVVLISGKGDRTYQELADTIVPFDDRLVARERLRFNFAPHHRFERAALVNS